MGGKAGRHARTFAVADSATDGDTSYAYAKVNGGAGACSGEEITERTLVIFG